MLRLKNSLSSLRRFAAAATFIAGLAILPAHAQNSGSDNQGKHLDIQSSSGDLHVGEDADARKAGLPLYPGARPHHDDDNTDANLSLFTEAFGFKLIVAKYDSIDAPAKIIDFYRDSLKKYGKVLVCHSSKHGGARMDADDDDKNSSKDKELKCEGDNSGPVTELKVGTQNNQHVVEIEPVEGHSGASFSIVYLRARGKQGDL